MKPDTTQPPATPSRRTLVFERAAPLDLAETLDGGQAFRWRAGGDGSYAGVVARQVVRASLRGGRLTIEGAPPAARPFWRAYFALDLDYGAIRRRLAEDPALRECLGFARGLRVLRQEFFEALVTFILTQNNNVPRVKGIVARLCATFGDPLGGDFEGEPAFAFPSPGRLAALDESDLACLRAGYRVPGILDAARQVVSGRLDETALKTLPVPEARARLLGVRGVGPKVADCVLLYGLGRFDCCPVDVWIRRALARFFPDGLPACSNGIAGIAQQYLFHYARLHGLDGR